MDIAYIVTAKTRARNFGLVSQARLVRGGRGGGGGGGVGGGEVWLTRLIWPSFILLDNTARRLLTILISLKLPFELQLVFITQS